MAKRKYFKYLIEPFGKYFDKRYDAERLFYSTGKTTTTLYGLTKNNEWEEIKEKY